MRQIIVVMSLLFCLISCSSQRKDLVFIGDSLTEMAPWDRFFGYQYNLVNLGVGGYQSKHLLERDFLNTLSDINPSCVVVMLGINDAMNDVEVRQTIENYSKILEELQSMDVDILVQSTLFQGHSKNQDFVLELNQFLMGWCAENEARFLDLNAWLSKDNMLLDKYTTDGTHLNSVAYEEWAKQLDKLITLLSD